MTQIIQRLAVIDDDPHTAQMTSWQVEDAGFEPVLYPDPSVNNIQHLTMWVARSAEGAICDHRLMARGFASFYGARVVGELFRNERMPAILVTQYVDMDEDVSIRECRRDIPVLLSRDEAEAGTISKGIATCIRELNGEVPSARKPYRTLVHVDEIGDESNQTVLDVIIPSWNNHHAVRLPLTLIPRDLQPLVSAGMWLMADVNIGAELSRDLFFAEFELAPEPTDDAFA